jgi:hypothetical protein
MNVTSLTASAGAAVEGGAWVVVVVATVVVVAVVDDDGGDEVVVAGLPESAHEATRQQSATVGTNLFMIPTFREPRTNSILF